MCPKCPPIFQHTREPAEKPCLAQPRVEQFSGILNHMACAWRQHLIEADSPNLNVNFTLLHIALQYAIIFHFVPVHLRAGVHARSKGKGGPLQEKPPSC